MKLKTVTLLTAIAQLISVLVSLVTLFVTPSENSWLYIIQPIHLVCRAMLVVFFFTLVARQKQA